MDTARPKARAEEGGEGLRCAWPSLLPATAEGMSAVTGNAQVPTVLDQHCFRALGKLVVGNLDRIADIDHVRD